MNPKQRIRENILAQSFFRKRHIVEWIKKGYPLPLPSVIKQEAVLYHAVANKLDILVETGTFLGEMVLAQLPFFRRIYSIELSGEFYENACKKFRGMDNVELLLGDSSEKLGEVIVRLDSPAIFWLDGHYSGGNTARGEKICPIYDELRHVFSSKHDHTILIDDARLFDGTDDYPTSSDLRRFVLTNSGYTVREENDMFVLNKPSKLSQI